MTIRFITFFILGLNFGFSQTVYSISSLPTVPSSHFTLAENSDHSIHLSVFIDSNATLNGFKTTLDGNHELTWDLTAFNKNEWVELKHDFTTTAELINPVFKIEIIDDNTSGTGFGIFYVDDIKIYDNSSLSITDILNKVSISPNPVSNLLTLKNIPSNSEILIYSILGTNFNAPLKGMGNDSYSIEMSNLASGLYVLKVINEDKSITKKIIKN